MFKQMISKLIEDNQFMIKSIPSSCKRTIKFLRLSRRHVLMKRLSLSKFKKRRAIKTGEKVQLGLHQNKSQSLPSSWKITIKCPRLSKKLVLMKRLSLSVSLQVKAIHSQEKVIVGFQRTKAILSEQIEVILPLVGIHSS